MKRKKQSTGFLEHKNNQPTAREMTHQILSRFLVSNVTCLSDHSARTPFLLPIHTKATQYQIEKQPIELKHEENQIRGDDD
jgi:hypothetical protein